MYISTYTDEIPQKDTANLGDIIFLKSVERKDLLSKSITMYNFLMSRENKNSYIL